MLAGILLSGCAHAPLDSQLVTVTADSSSCDASSGEASVLLTVHNGSPGKLRISAQYENGPPFTMGWPYYAVLRAPADPAAVYQSPAGHANLPIATVAIGRNDQTQFSIPLYREPPDSPHLRYRVQFEDLDGNVYFSQPFGICF